LKNTIFLNHWREDGRGKYFGDSTGIRLDDAHCLELGIEARTLGYFTTSIDWLEYSLERITKKLGSTEQGTELAGVLKTIQGELAETLDVVNTKNQTLNLPTSSSGCTYSSKHDVI